MVHTLFIYITQLFNITFLIKRGIFHVFALNEYRDTNETFMKSSIKCPTKLFKNTVLHNEHNCKDIIKYFHLEVELMRTAIMRKTYFA